MKTFRYRAEALGVALAIGWACRGTNAAVTILGAQYQPDQMFPEYDCFWHDSKYPTSCQTNVQGATVHVYVKNTGTSAVTINDATLAGYSLKTVIKKSTASWNPDEQNSIYFYWDNPPQDILNAGEPVWYRLDPPTIPAGGVAQVAVRLRLVPTTPTISVGVVTSAGTVARNVAIDANAPQLASIGYSDDLKKVYLHWRRSGGAAPTSVWLDGTNVTPLTTTVGDPSVNFGASVVSLPNALPSFSYHVFQGVYADSKTATASQRAWTNKFIYASYSTFTFSPDYTGSNWIVEATDHGLNNVQMNLGDMGSYMGTSAGQALMRTYGYGYTILDPSKLNPIDPDMWFLNDEPDAEEDNQSNTHCGTGLRIPCGGGHNAGTLVIKEIAHGEDLRARRPNVPTVVNLNNTLKPQSYFTWGQAVDILQFDNYYQRRLSDSYWRFPRLIPLYRKATYVYAHARVGCAGAEPNPSNQLLYSCEWKCTYADCGDHNGDVWPFPTPASKRIEVYYSLAGGSKGLGYWWFKPGYPSNGLADQDTAAARSLWKEIGLIGNEIRTARPLIVRSTPVNLTLTPSANVWARSLASGTDTVLLLVVNDDYYNDLAGCHYTPVTNATLTATLPSWMQSSPTAFEITAGGLRDVNTQLAGNRLQMNLGTLQLTRMIVLTTNPQLRPAIEQRYREEVEPRVRRFAPELFAEAPRITQQPASVYAAPGGTVNFTVVVSGSSPLSYQWQKNTLKLNNGGHYSGCTTATLTVGAADSADVASYRCVVTNAYGSVTSSVAMLLLGGPCSTPTLLNASFEGGTNAVGIGTNWVGYQRPPFPTTVWTLQSAAPPPGAGVKYQQIANTSGTGGGGVRQDLTGCTIGSAYQISGWMRGNSAYATCTVKVSPSASTNWSTAVDLDPPQTYSGASWTPFSGTVIATGTNMTLWLDGQTGGTGLNKAECFDAVTVTCLAPPPVPPAIVSQPMSRTNNLGTAATFSVLAEGTPPLSFQWRKDQINLAGATNALLVLHQVQKADEGLYSVVVTNAFGSVVSSNALLVVNQPPVTDAGATRKVIISCNGTNAAAVLNGTRTSDPDGDLLQYAWYEAGTPLASGVVAIVVLPVGVHPVLLVVRDGMMSVTNAVTIRVITSAQAVQELMAQVTANWPVSKPLLATLSAASASLGRGDCTPALNQLTTFQKKVRVQVEPSASALARSFVQAAQDIVDALDCCHKARSGRSVGRLTSLVRHPKGRTELRFSATPGRLYILEASTNLVNWEMIGVAVDQGDGTFTCEDTDDARSSKRFYRIRVQ